MGPAGHLHPGRAHARARDPCPRPPTRRRNRTSPSRELSTAVSDDGGAQSVGRSRPSGRTGAGRHEPGVGCHRAPGHPLDTTAAQMTVQLAYHSDPHAIDRIAQGLSSTERNELETAVYAARRNGYTIVDHADGLVRQSRLPSSTSRALPPPWRFSVLNRRRASPLVRPNSPTYLIPLPHSLMNWVAATEGHRIRSRHTMSSLRQSPPDRAGTSSGVTTSWAPSTS